MASGYFNSAGTDLDSLFYIDNANAGAIGFIASDGRDLGNRYTKASTLGYAVGLVNSAGTDLGYLRGNLTKPAISSGSLTNTKTRSLSKAGCGYDRCSETVCCSEEGSNTLIEGYLTLKLTLKQSAAHSITVKTSLTNKHPRDREDVGVIWKAGTTARPMDAELIRDPCDCGFEPDKPTGGFYFSFRPGETSQMQVYTGSFTSNTFTLQIAYSLAVLGYNNDLYRTGTISSAKTYVTLTNALGATTAVYEANF